MTTPAYVSVRLPAELAARVDGVRGDVPRDRWVRRALEAVLDGREHPLWTLDAATGEVHPALRALDDSAALEAISGSGASRTGPVSPVSPRTPTSAGPCPECGRYNGVHKRECTLR